jgi:hypothetical protein
MGSPIDFFDDLCRKTDGGRKLPTWKGELYLELHRGVSVTLLSLLVLCEQELMSRRIPRRLGLKREIGIWRLF